MSLSPLNADAGETAPSHERFMANQNRLYDLLREGKSFSGHERNCCYLNLDGKQFANVSSVSGFDFADDSRALSLVDWDQDGDLDVWISNRTAPRVRLLRNDSKNRSQNGHHFLQIQLHGTTSNRDAIGARVEVVLPDARETVLMQTLRAGEGFLGQSSKRLHFGLGKHTQTARVTVRWPGGKSETFAGVAAGRFYKIIEGSGQIREVDAMTPKSTNVEATAIDSSAARSVDSPVTEPSASVRATTVLPTPLPPLAYESWDGESVSWSTLNGQPCLILLWASWCEPCLTEIAQLIQRATELSKAGVQVIALTVDSDNGGAPAERNTARALLKQAGFPFASGVLPVETFDKLQLLHDQLFGWRAPLAVPTSLLCDSSGRLTVFYQGPVSVDQIVADVGRSEQGANPQEEFGGFWVRPPRISLTLVAQKLLEHGYVDDVVDYVAAEPNSFLPDRNLAKLHGQIGVKHFELNRFVEAETQFRAAIAIDRTNPLFYLGLADSLTSQGKPDLAIDQLRTARQYDSRHFGATVGLADALRKSGNRAGAIELYRLAVELDAEDADVWQNLGVTHTMDGQFAQAVISFENALRLAPGNADVHANLALALVRTGRPGDAVDHLETSLELQPKAPSVHNNLGGLLAQMGKLDDAERHFESAVELQPENPKYRRNLSAIRERRQRGRTP